MLCDSDSDLSSDSAQPSHSEALPLCKWRHDPRQCYQRYGYALQTRDSLSQQLAAEIEARRPQDARYTLTIAGEVQQLDLQAGSSARQRVGGLSAGQLARIRQLAVDTAHEVTQLPSDRFQVGAIKMLTAAQGKGEQPIHWDSHNGFMERRHYTFLLYTTDGTDSTAMWQWPQERLPQRHRAADMRLAASLLFDKAQYHHVPVQQGDCMFFRQAVPHYGVLNATHPERRVVFVLLLGAHIFTPCKQVCEIERGRLQRSSRCLSLCCLCPCPN